MAEGRFEGRNFLVTGATRGIGAAVADQLRLEGADVIGTSRSADDFGQLQDRSITPVALDITASTDATNIRKFWVEATQDGRIDGVILNAGTSGENGGGLFKDYDLNELFRIIHVNTTVPLMIASLAFEGLMRSSGSLVAVSSIVGLKGHAAQVPYAASKGALIPAVASMAKEARRTQMRTAIVGYAETDMTAGFTDKQKAAFIESTSKERAATAAEVASFILNLATPEAVNELGEPVPHGGYATFNVKEEHAVVI